jgi:hypothetical protein
MGKGRIRVGIVGLSVRPDYERLAADICDGTQTAPSFRDAVALHELIDLVERSDRG